MTNMRAKVRIIGLTPNGQQENLTFAFPAKNSAYPADGSDEDQSFSKFTPSASLSMTIANPALVGKFAVGDTFYLDFTKIED